MAKRRLNLGSIFVFVIVVAITYFSVHYILKTLTKRDHMQGLRMAYKFKSVVHTGFEPYRIVCKPMKEMYEPGHINETEIHVERLCPHRGKFTKLLILTHSALNHTEARRAIRLTWGSYRTRKDISHAFVLGRSLNEILNEAVTHENSIFGDLIRGKFIDSYGNVTLKAISWLEWTDRHCPHAKYILKTDDDVFINVPKLIAFLDRQKYQRVIYGAFARGLRPERDIRNKYYVSRTVYPGSMFPTFILGPAFVFRSLIVHDLYVEMLKANFFRFDDVLLTGIVPEKLGIPRAISKGFINVRLDYTVDVVQKLISFHKITPSDQFELWQMLNAENRQNNVSKKVYEM